MPDLQKIYKDQTALEIQLDTGVTTGTVTEALIKYKAPDETTGEWAADFEAGVVSVTCEDGKIDQAGTWVLWPYLTFADATEAPGEAVQVKVWEEGQ